MKLEALFCDGTEGYVIPMEPQPYSNVKFRFRTARKDVCGVCLLTDTNTFYMEKVEERGRFDYYEVELFLKEEPFSYLFQITGEDTTVYYGRTGVLQEKLEEYYFCVVPGFSTPDWAKGAIMYQIYTDRFYNGDPSNDVETREYFYIGDYSKQVKDWYQYPDVMGVREFYGGDLQGVLDKLDYLQDLGVEVLYFNPLFVSPSNHKYDIQDYDFIDPHLGRIVEDGGEVLSPEVRENTKATKYKKRTGDYRNLEASNRLFIELVEEIHRRGMKVIIDGVFNHCGSFNKWLDRERIYEGQEGYEKGAYLSEESPYRSYFHFHTEDWPYNHHYDGWWGHDTLPKLNYENSTKLENYILSIGKKWVSPPYNVDGWRLDVAADLGHSQEYNHSFWKKFRQVVKYANPEALILAEHYGNPREWLKGDEWDTVMNYDAFMEPITWFLTGMEKHSDEKREDLLGNGDYFFRTMLHHQAHMLPSSLQVSMNQLSNHDHSRFLTRTNGKVGRVATLGSKAAEEGVKKSVFRIGVVMQMTWMGAPTLYYGDEAGLCGFTDPDNRRTYPWGREDKDLISFHKEVIRIQKQFVSLRRGSWIPLWTGHHVISYGRFQEGEAVIVVVNNQNQLQKIQIPVWLSEVEEKSVLYRRLYTYEDGYTTDEEEFLVEDGMLEVNMGSHSALILSSK